MHARAAPGLALVELGVPSSPVYRHTDVEQHLFSVFHRTWSTAHHGHTRHTNMSTSRVLQRANAVTKLLNWSISLPLAQIRRGASPSCPISRPPGTARRRTRRLRVPLHTNPGRRGGNSLNQAQAPRMMMRHALPAGAENYLNPVFLIDQLAGSVYNHQRVSGTKRRTPLLYGNYLRA